MNALVTGGGGFLGAAVVRRLRERGDQVHSYSRRRYAELDALGVTQHQGDIADPIALSRAAAGCDIFFHVAAKAGVGGRSREYHRANVLGTDNVLTACRHHGITRLVYTSSPSVVFDGRDMAGVKQTMARTDELRDEFHARIESIRADMLAQVAAAAKNVMTAQSRAIVISAIVTAIAAVLDASADIKLNQQA